MNENFDWKAFKEAEVSRLLSEIEAIEQAEGKPTFCENHSGEATVEAFEKASNFIIDAFVEKAKNLR